MVGGFRSRRAARRLCLAVLYEAEIKGTSPIAILMSQEVGQDLLGDDTDPAESDADASEDARAYADVLVRGVVEHGSEIDALIERGADRWEISRMPIVDRNIARMAVFELMWRSDVPVAVSINEAVELAKALSTEDSGRFINGLLGQIALSSPQKVTPHE